MRTAARIVGGVAGMQSRPFIPVKKIKERRDEREVTVIALFTECFHRLSARHGSSTGGVVEFS